MSTMPFNLQKGPTPPLNRRQFIKSAGGSALAFSIIKPESVCSSQANSKIRLGLIGCGGRGNWIANLFIEQGGFEISALADYFPEKTKIAAEKFGVSAEKCFDGLLAYQKLLDSKTVDAVAIESPPYFHPIHAAAAVNAGVHVFLAKPVAVDVPGSLTIADLAKKATVNQQVFLVDFQTRTNEWYREAVKRVQFGEIGKIVCGEAAYHAGPTWDQYAPLFKKTQVSAEERLRAWGVDRSLSGDVITEQNIHALDVAAWILNAEPIQAVGAGGQHRKYGTCWDYFSVIFSFPQNVLLSFNSKQLGQGQDDILCRMYGSEGTIETNYFGSVSIRGNVPYKGGELKNLYAEGAKANIVDFYESITTHRYANETAAPSVRSNLTTILGRTAAYRHGLVTWQEMLRSGEKFEPDLQGLKM
jgi:myo-inositol 2-dehydrogenase / D-chiro-inositol 1-dehydrogenase